MAEVSSASGFLLYSHVIPMILGFFGVLFIANGVMDDQLEYTIIGVVLFLAAGILPFLILRFILGV